tara:strand:- start:137 stop:586 length:450 start_codon:yes stop_codon:yes gene_type:complete
MKILFVCTGNICRSPTAHGVVRQLCKNRNINNIKCDSAALYDYHIGNPPDKRAIEIAGKFGIDISDIKARKIKLIDFEVFDLILGMDIGHVEGLKKIGDDKNTIDLFLNLSKKTGVSVPDPYYGDKNDFIYSFKLIEYGANAIIKKFQY